MRGPRLVVIPGCYPRTFPVLAVLLALGLPLLPIGTPAADYRRPPEPIPWIVDASPRLPQAVPDPTGRTLLLAERPPRPRLADRAASAIEVGGIRLDPRTNRRPDSLTHSGFLLKRVGGPGERRVVHPEGFALGPPMWSPDGRRIAFSAVGPEGTELWVAEAEAERPRARRVLGPVLNEAFGRACRWLPNARHLLCRRVPRERPPPSFARALLDPIAIGPEAPSRPLDARTSGLRRPGLLEHHLASRLVLVDAVSGSERPLGRAGLIERAAPSPNGSHLLVSRLAESRALLVEGPRSRITEVWNAAGRPVRRLSGAPAEPDPPAARGFRWAAGEPATLVWPERLARASPPRDRLVRMEAPFEGPPSELLRLRGTFSGIAWVPDEGAALVHDYERRTRRRRTWLVETTRDPEGEPRLLWDRSVDDAYSDPGRPLRVVSSTGRRVVASHEGAVFLAGTGARPGGARPFLDRLDLETFESERLWQSSESRHERVTDLLSPEGPRVLVRHESPSQPPNYAVLALDEESGEATLRPITSVEAPASPLRKVRRRGLRYQRADGVPLAGTLYVPADREEGERVPLLLWIYPRKHSSAETTAQARSSSRRYLDVEGVSPLPLATQGFAVLTAAMPVVGDSEEANDHFAEQIVENAKAAVEAAVASGVVDGERVAVGGHSYGAFAAVSLLARTDLFEAGLALSGSYNRTLTPFGFQTERRTLWEARETYLEMSPLLRADHIREPVLLVHGEEDEHPGTPPQQSVLLYRAIRETGGTARLVVLPHEGHVYRARESTLHVYAELVAWLERHLKGRAPAPEGFQRADSSERSRGSDHSS